MAETVLLFVFVCGKGPKTTTGVFVAFTASSNPNNNLSKTRFKKKENHNSDFEKVGCGESLLQFFSYLETSNAKKDLGNAFFSEFCVDPCLADFFFTIFISKFGFSRTMSDVRDKNRGFGLVLRKMDL